MSYDCVVISFSFLNTLFFALLVYLGVYTLFLYVKLQVYTLMIVQE